MKTDVTQDSSKADNDDDDDDVGGDDACAAASVEEWLDYTNGESSERMGEERERSDFSF